jgi:hypothetical protein
MEAAATGKDRQTDEHDCTSGSMRTEAVGGTVFQSMSKLGED